MSLWSQENARLILDRLCEHPSVTAAAKMIGSNSKIIWVWARSSARDKANNVTDSKFIIHGWPDDSDDSEPVWFSDALQTARNIHALNMDMDHRDLINNGVERPVIEGGRFHYVVDPKAIADCRDAEEGLLLGYDDWPYAHDERGARIVLTVKEHVPAQLKIHALRALLPLWNPPERRETDTRSQSSVLVLHGDVRPRPNKEATPLRMDLETKLAAIRANPQRETAKPNAAVDVGHGRANPADPPERISAPSDETPTTVEELTAPPPRPAPPNYGRPTSNLNAEDRRGPMPPGGFRVR
jgi:hypothetical protein